MDEKQKRPQEKPGDYLQNAEMAVEGNYNMIDGIINNAPPSGDDLTDGQTWDEIQSLAPETLPEARQAKKSSVRARLNVPSKRGPGAREKKRPRHSLDRDR